MTEEDPTRLNRRSMMKKAAATATIGAGVAAASGSATAEPTVEARYADPLRTESLLTDHAGELVAALANDDLLASEDVFSELPTRRTVGYSELAKRTEGTTYLEGLADNRADEIVTVKQVDDGVLSITVEPDTGRAYAFHEPESGETRLYNTDIGAKGIDVQACDTTCTCGNPACDGSYSAECTTCCSGDCQTNYFCNC